LASSWVAASTSREADLDAHAVGLDRRDEGIVGVPVEAANDHECELAAQTKPLFDHDARGLREFVDHRDGLDPALREEDTRPS